jgi:hypothetical protein
VRRLIAARGRVTVVQKIYAAICFVLRAGRPCAAESRAMPSFHTLRPTGQRLTAHVHLASDFYDEQFTARD